MSSGGRRRATLYYPLLVGALASSLFPCASSTVRGGHHGLGHGGQHLVDLHKEGPDDRAPIRSLGEKGKKKQKKKKKNSASCKKDPFQPHCLLPSTPILAAPAPVANPDPPPDQCVTSTFVTPSDDSDTVTKFSFTNEIDLIIDCGSALDWGGIERSFVNYQNQLLGIYGCTDEIEYVAAAVTSVCAPGGEEDDGNNCRSVCKGDLLGLEDAGGGGSEDCVEIEELCNSSNRNRNLVQSSAGSANLRYKYNTLGNCRRYCAEKSLPKEDSCVDCGGRNLRQQQRRDEEEGDERALLVETLNSGGVQANGASVRSDGKNDCPADGGGDCCTTDGKCCGVTPGCSCPTVSNTYCGVTRCDLPGCCGSIAREVALGEDPIYAVCPWDNDVCFCEKSLECDGREACSEYRVCSEEPDIC